MRGILLLLILCSTFDPGTGNPYLIYANRTGIQLIDAGSRQGNSTVIVGGLEDAVALDYSYDDGYVFWTDVSLAKIKKTRLPSKTTSQATSIVIATGLVAPDGLACDWLGKKLYWTDSDNNRLEVSNFDGSSRKVLFWQDLDQPRAIALDPENGYMYWTDWGEVPKIERAGMDGNASTRSTIIIDNVSWPNGLTIDYDAARLFWADAHFNFIHSSNYDGSERQEVIRSNLPHPFAVTLFEDTIYWTDWKTGSIHSCNKLTGDNLTVVHSNILSPMDIHVFAKQRQPTGVNPCGSNNGGCSGLCLMSPNKPFYKCACPTGVKLLSDGKTCANGSEKILLLQRRTDIRRISLDTPDYTDVVLQLQNIKHGIAIDYDPVEGYVYWTDDEVRAIQRAYIDGSGQEPIITTEVDHPDGIAVDPIARNIYWTDTGTDRIEVARLNGSSRRVLISEHLDEPRAIQLEPVEGLMYWTDWGRKPKIERANLDGSDRVVLVNTSLKWPNSLAIDQVERKIYWGDAQLDRIEMMNMDGTGRKILLSKTQGTTLPHIFGFSLLGEHIYWTDWQTRVIERVNKRTGDHREIIIEELPDLMGLKAIDVNAVIGTNKCELNNGGCSHLCLYCPEPKGIQCACPMGLELLANGKTCIVPEAFLLFTRREDIRRISLETNHNDDVIPLNNIKEAIALDFDVTDNRIYWTDIKLKTISRAFMNGSQVETVIEYGLQFPEGMAVDWVADNIYWVDTGTNRIEVSRVDGSSRKVLVWKNLANPRTLALDPPQGHMYWTDWGTNPKIERAALDGTHRTVIIGRVGRVNALTIDYEERRLFWADMDSNIIEASDMDGLQRVTILHENLPNPYSITQYQDFLYWTDWNAKSIERANKSSGLNRTVIQDRVDYVMDILVFHASRQSGWNPCGLYNGECQHLCLAHSQEHKSPLTHHCDCPTHYVLASDNRTCAAPDTYILFSQRNMINRFLVDTKESPDIVLPIQGLRMIRSISYDPVDKYVYWVDQRGKVIKRALDNGTRAQFVIPQHVDVEPFDLAVNPYSRHLYWSCSQSNVINVTRLDDMSHVGVLISGSDQKPRSIVLSPERGYMFWTNMGNQPKIQRAGLDGKDIFTVADSDMRSPGSLAVDLEFLRIYWTDVNLKRIESADFDGGNRKVLIEDQILNPLSVAVLEDYLYWIDKDAQVIERVDKVTGSQRQMIQGRVLHLSDIHVVTPITHQHRRDHPCSVDNGGCSHICLPQDDGTSECSCPKGLEIKNEVYCEEPPTCSPEQFTCVSGSVNCIPLTWRCDYYPECEDESDEADCPACGIGEFQCQKGTCIPVGQRCDGRFDCADSSDEANCCLDNQFQCRDSSCVDERSVCDGLVHCPDASDEEQCRTTTMTVPYQVNSGSKGPAQYSLAIAVAVSSITIIVIVCLVCWYRNKQSRRQNNDIVMVAKGMNPMFDLDSPPHTLSSSRGKSATTMLSMTSVPSGTMYDRNHVTGASSSSSCVTHYPHETLNPPPSPVTDRSVCMGEVYSSNSPSTIRSGRIYKRCHIPPLHTTPCSTDVNEDSEPYAPPPRVTRTRTKKYYAIEPYDSDPYPPPPTPRTNYFSDDPSCPPSPTTERSFYHNPYPPPPSPVETSDC